MLRQRKSSVVIDSDHERVSDTLLNTVEKRALEWLAGKMPGWVTPDLLTATGFMAASIVFLGYWLSNISSGFLWLASFGFVLNWFGDSLDGTLARHRKIERPKFGYFIDHSMDALTQLLICTGIGLSPYISMKFALFFLIGYLLVSIHTYILIHVKRIFKLSYWKLGPTEARVLAILANMFVYFFGVPGFRIPVFSMTVYECAFLLTGAFLIAVFVISTVKQAIQLSLAD